MSDSGEFYYPVSRPPVNPSIRMRKPSKERTHPNYTSNALTKVKIHPSDVDLNDKQFGKYLDLDIASVERSLSLTNLTNVNTLKNNRSLSASNLYALADPNLSLKEALSKKVYDKPNTAFAKEKALFTAYSQKYFYQLTVGCGNDACTNIFCYSSGSKRFNSGMSALLSIELSNYRSQYLCVKESKKQEAKLFDHDVFRCCETDACLNTDASDDNNNNHNCHCNDKNNNKNNNNKDNEIDKVKGVPFLYSFYSTTPFRSLFLPCPLVSSGLALHKTHSYMELNKSSMEGSTMTNMISSTVKTHLNALASAVSASLSNIWRPASFEVKNEDTETGMLANDGVNECTSTEDITSTVVELVDSDSKELDSEGHEVITTRMRLPSIRMFGSGHAVDIDCDAEDIDAFESTVTQEFTNDLFEDDIPQPHPPPQSTHQHHEKDSNEFLHQVPDLQSEVEQGADSDAGGYSLTHLTLDMFNSVVQNYNECKDTSFLINTIRTVFSSWDSLEMSFCNEGITKSMIYPFDMKFKDVNRVFTTIMTMEICDVVIGVLMDTVKIMLLSRSYVINDPADLKPLVIVLEIPWLFRFDQVALEIASIISELSPPCKGMISLYMSNLPKANFRSMLMGFKSLLNGQAYWNNMSSGKNSTAVVSLFRTLQVVYVANNRDDYLLLLPNAEFYDKELTSRIDFKQEYTHWKKLEDIELLQDDDSILNYPFLLEPSIKVQVIHIDAITQMREEYQDAIVHQARIQQVQKSWNDFNDPSKLSSEVQAAMCPYLLLEIRRDNFVEDTLKQLEEKSADLKKPLKIKYANVGEQGLDMGGLQKEFFQVIIEAIFDPSYSLFTTSEDSCFVWFNAFTLESYVMYELVGILLGLAIYNGIILDVHFPLVVYKKLLGYKLALHDLADIQPTLCKGLQQLLLYDGDVETDFDLTFDVCHSMYGRELKVDLVPNGSTIPVNNENRHHFVDLYVDYLLNSSVMQQFNAFSNGFYQVCKGPTMQLCTPPELELLICGSPDLDFKALEEITEYKDGFSKNHPLMAELWEIIHSFTNEQKKSLLMFVTGSYRVPLKGLGSMSFYVQRNGPDSSNLPTAMTCFNRLLLPEYSDAKKLKSMLLLAIENAKGFGLT